MRAAVAAAILILSAGAATAEPAPGPDRPLADASQEARAQALFQVVRCVVCQNEAISDSPAGIAADMRGLIRREIAAGASDEAVREDLVRRWGDFVLFKPPVRPSTWLLWFGPGLAALLAVVALAWNARRRPSPTTPLAPDEEARLKALLDDATIRPDPDATSSHD